MGFGKIILPAVLAVLLATACKEVEDPFQLPPVEDGDYYPLEPGKYWIYTVDSIIFDLNAPKRVDTSLHWVKEVVADTFLDLTGRPWYRIERYERTNGTLPWTIKQVVAATISGGQALRLENDLTFIKLLFPITPFATWDGNKLFDPATTVNVRGETIEMFKGWEYRVTDAGIPDTIGGNIYPEVAVIRQADSENLVEKRFSEERYARGVGLVSRELQILDTQQIDETRPWEEKAEKGFILHQRLVENN